MQAHRVQLLTENLPEQRFLEAIFLEELRRGLLTVSSFLTPDSALAGAELYLLQHPERPIALVLNAGIRPSEAVARKSAAIGRILSRITPDNWHVTLAIPKVDDWVDADPKLRAEFESDEATWNNRYERAVRICAIAERIDIDRRKIAESHPEFAGLAEYVRSRISIPQPTA